MDWLFDYRKPTILNPNSYDFPLMVPRRWHDGWECEVITNLIISWFALNGVMVVMPFVGRLLLANDGERQQKLFTVIDHLT
jgi:hypothetical protein